MLSLGADELPFRWAGVKQHGAEGRQDLGGGRDGELSGHRDESRSVSSAQGENQAERGGAAAVTLIWRERCRCSGEEARGVQPLDAAIGHGQDGLNLLAALGCQHSGHQVAAVRGNSEDTWEHRTIAWESFEA